MNFKTIFKRAIDFNRFPLLINIVLVLSSCGSHNQDIDPRTVFKYNTDNGITSLDPAFARTQDNIWATSQLFNGLVQLDSHLLIQPSIAKKWDISTDGTVYRFYLRDDVFFHRSKIFNKYSSEKVNRNRKVVASDFVFSFNRIMDEATASPGAWIFNDKVAKNPFVAINDSTLEINLSKPFPAFLELLTMPYCFVLPKEAIKAYGKDFGRQPVGTGPFMFSRWNEEVKLIFLKNPLYFEMEEAFINKDESKLTSKNRLPYLDAIAISFLDDKQTAFLEFLQGKLDFFNGLESSFKDEIIEDDGTLKKKYRNQFTTLVTPFLNTEYLAFLVDDTLKHSITHPLYNQNLRLAIQLAINKKAIIKHLRNNIGHAADGGFVPIGLLGYSPALASQWGYNPEKAKKYLNASNWLKTKQKITLYITKDYLDICLFVQKDLKAIGLDVTLEVQPASFLKEQKSNTKLNFFRGSWIADYPDAENYLACFYSPNFSPNGPNYTHFKNSYYDQLFESIFKETDIMARQIKYQKMDSILMAESPVVPLFYDQSIRLIHNRVKNMSNNASNSLDLRRVKILAP